ncbi:DNA-3-methyladenine glycosylase family protein [Dyadobacter luticola]|uniref:DNA-3-methyladenine glycosylase II n=1 Tax=Dyadobacter luticola TaxID=1979387 RepID=A0A5R9L3Y0_9BACT|nr:DNA-3-methyladenine glycosylase [Dyadobacter luticola]TLV02985.1 DNA-3-methyladenine glycosylase 2 family protein [Dyadobacter luticola]
MDNDRRVLIPIPALFSFEECLWFLNRNYDDCLHLIKNNTIYKSLALDGELLLIAIKSNGAFLDVSVLEGNVSAEAKDFLTKYVVDWFDMDRNIQPFYDGLLADNRLSYMADAYQGLRVIGIANLFEAICWSIIGQQINLSFAYRLKRRLVERFGEHLEYDNHVYHIFPAAEILAEAEVDELRGMQFSQKKAEYLIGIARAFLDGSLSKEMLLDLPDFEARKKALISHKGIGVWTANYALMKSLKEPEGIPHGDIGLLNALTSHGIIQERSETQKIDALFAQFKGWESYLVFYLWRSLAVKELA